MTAPIPGAIPNRVLGALDGRLGVSARGLGCMGMSEFYGPRDDARSISASRFSARWRPTGSATPKRWSAV